MNKQFYYDKAFDRGENVRALDNNRMVAFSNYTGRCATKKRVVEINDDMLWKDNTKFITTEQWLNLCEDIEKYETFSQRLKVGKSFHARIRTEYAWHALFINNMLSSNTLPGDHVDMEVISIPSFKPNAERHGEDDVLIAVNLPLHKVIIVGSEYGGEIKKSVFTLMNYILPKQNVLTMHCSANTDGDSTALFFGLSGTGKTTLSADPKRQLIGDDEHYWTHWGVANIEGGCYAKTIGLTEESEPEIWAAAHSEYAIFENVVFDDDGNPDFNDTSLTENGRVCYSISNVPNHVPDRRGPQVRDVVFLTADGLGVLPPVKQLDYDEAVLWFEIGYTSKVAGTEAGVTGVVPTSSPCFGAPFIPLKPNVYSHLLKQQLLLYKPRVWLVNTGWLGDPATTDRMSLPVTRGIIDGIHDKGSFLKQIQSKLGL